MSVISFKTNVLMSPQQGAADLYRRIVLETEKRLRTVGAMVTAQVQQNLSRPSPPPGEAGGYPGMRTGKLAGSIGWRMETGLKVSISSSDPKAELLIKGHPGGTMIYPVHAKALRWWDWQAGMYRFAKVVRQGALAPRPFLTKTFTEMWPTIRRIMTEPI